MANVTATTGTDNFNGTSGTTAGNDQISVTAQSRVQTGDLYDGGAGFDTLRITTSNINFTSIVTGATSGIKNIERLLYSGSTTMTFRSDQFGDGLISNTLNVTGTTGTQTLAINYSLGGSLDMSGWTYTTWTAGTDLITATGSGSNDRLTVGTGRVTFNGGSGNDTIDFSQLSGASISLTLNGATAISATSSAGVVYTLSNVEYVIGTSGNDTINGDAAANFITGGAGNDTLSGGDGDDKFVLGQGFGTDTITGGEAGETAGDRILARGVTSNLTVTFSGAEAGTITDGTNTATFSQIERVLGGLGDDTMTAAGVTASVTLDGGAGSDTLTGGSGNDILIGDGDLLVNGSLEAGLAAGAIGYLAVEGWTNSSGDSFEVWGDGFNGEAAADGVNFIELDNGFSLDGAYQDVHTAAGQTYVLTFWINQREAGTDSVELYWNGALVATLTPPSGPTQYTYTLTASGPLTRLEFREPVASNDSIGIMLDAIALTPTGDDVLDGGAGADTMAGGRGSDTYYVDNVGDLVTDRVTDAGTDLVYSTVTFAATGANQDGIENITLTGTASVNATGNALDNVITGNVAANLLDGGAGSDVIEGGLGSDTLTGGSGADDIVFDAFDASATQLDTVTDFSVAEDQVVFKSNGPSSEHVLRTYMLDALKTGAAQFYTWWNGREQSLTLTGLTAASLTSANFVFDTSAVARVVTGTALGDVLFGGLGNDNLSGGAGDDLLLGDAGDDTLTGGTGSNRYEGGAGADTFDGSASGSDRVDYTTPGGITLILNGSGVGGAGSLGEALGDTFIGIESIRATKDNDVITVDTFVDTVIGFDGDDIINGSSDKNDLQGGNGTDTIVSGGGNDYLSGGAGNDTLTITGTYTLAQAVGGAGDDIITGGDFADILYGGADNDTIDGGNGADFIYGEAGADIAHGGGGNDIFTDADGMSGDQYFGEAGYDRIIYTVGGTFNFTAGGADIIDATIENVIFQAAVTVTGTSLANTYSGSASGDTISGGDGHDWINGGAGNDTLNGDAGDDRLHGDAGSDTLRGGQGSDTLSGGVPGGAGDGVRDNFLYFAADINTIDRIQGFEAGIDKITLDAASFGLAAGTLEASRFYAWGDAITTSGSAFIYRATDGALFWDANGSSAGGLNAMAYLNNIPALAASDIVVV